MKIQYRVRMYRICMKKIHRNKAHVLMAGYTDLVIFAHVAQARVGEENFQYALRYILHILYIYILPIITICVCAQGIYGASLLNGTVRRVGNGLCRPWSKEPKDGFRKHHAFAERIAL